VFSRIRDFRTLVNLSYVTYLARAMGISTPLAPVLSFPLGPNAITLLETCIAYSTIMTGTKSVIKEGNDLISSPVITRLEDRNGDTIWEYNPEEVRVLSKMNSCLTSEILRNVMTQGTGKKAGTEVATRIDGAGDSPVVIPAYGKTGTANRYTNSSFVGFIPGPANEKGDLRLDQGYVIAAYVGYDDNRPMHSKHTSIYGSTGALPLWAETANAVAKAPWYRKSLQPADLAFGTPELLGECGGELKEIFVNRVSGLPPKGEAADALQADTVKIYGNVERRFEPLEEFSQ
jgi:membrane peptidoglycan carboxypeptidase